MLHIAHDADDFEWLRRRAQEHVAADRILRGKHLRGECFADDRAPRRRGIVAAVERPPGGKGDSHHVEISGGRRTDHRLASGLALTRPHDKASAISGKREFIDRRDGTGSQAFQQGALERRVELRGARVRVDS